MTLTETDKRLIRAFANQQVGSGTSKHLNSDGTRIDLRGGYRVAHWSDGLLHFDPTYGNVSQTVAKAVARAVAPMDIAAGSQWILPEVTRKRIGKTNPRKAKRNPGKGGFRGNLFGADLALAKSIAKHTGALTWEYIDARPALAAKVKEARALGLTGLAAANFVFPPKGMPHRNPVVRRHKTVAEMRAAGVPDYFEKIQKRGEAYRPPTMLYETGEQRPVATHSGHFILSSGDHAALMHRRPVGADPDDTEYTVRGLYDVWGRRKNPDTFRELEERVRRAENAYQRARTAHSDSTTVARWNDLTAAVLALRDAKEREEAAMARAYKIAGVSPKPLPADYGKKWPMSNPRGKKRNPVPRASKAGPSGPRFGSGAERYYISDALAQSHARRLAPMTDENDHAGARLYLANTVLFSPTFTEKVKDGNARMDRSHTSAHYGDNEAAWKANHALQKRMLAQVKRRTSPAGYAAIYGAL